MWWRVSFTETRWCPQERGNIEKDVPLTRHRVDDHSIELSKIYRSREMILPDEENRKPV